MKKTYINPKTAWMDMDAIVLASESIDVNKYTGNPDEVYGKEDFEDDPEHKSIWDD